MACPSAKSYGSGTRGESRTGEAIRYKSSHFLRQAVDFSLHTSEANWRSNPSRGSISTFNIRHSTFNIHNSTFPTHPNKSVSSAFQKQTLYKISILNTLICLTWFKKKVLTKTLEATLSLYFNFSNPCHLRSKNDCYSK